MIGHLVQASEDLAQRGVALVIGDLDVKQVGARRDALVRAIASDDAGKEGAMAEAVTISEPETLTWVTPCRPFASGETPVSTSAT